MILLIIGLILFVGLVVIHEFGHFVMARRNGVDVEEFGIGFPPRVWSRKTKGGWLFSVNLLPLGGFVRMKGEHDADTTEGTFGAASLWAKTKIMAAGVVLNLVTALVLLTGLAWIGMPQLVDNQFTVASDTKVTPGTVRIGQVENNSPASKAGLKEGDTIVSVAPSGMIPQVCDKLNAQKTGTCQGKYVLSAPADLSRATKELQGKKVEIVLKRDGDNQEKLTATLRTDAEVDASKKTDNPKGYLGIVPLSGITTARSTWSAPVVAVGVTAQFTQLTFQGLGKAVVGLGKTIAGLGSYLVATVTGNDKAQADSQQRRSNGQKAASEQVSGPLGIFFVLKDGGALGFKFTLMIIAIISLTLAIMNILPIPALDGGRLWLTLITHGIGKPLSQEKEELINGLGFLFLMGLIVLITIVDAKRFF